MRRLILAAVVAAGTLATGSSEGAERWVDRPMTLHQLVFAGDVGLGIGHVNLPRPFNDYTGVGLNLEGALGVTEKFELGLRTGVRFGDEGKAASADAYGRTLWTETYNVGGATFANPELRARYVFYSGSIAEVGGDARIFLPTARGSSFGMMIGVPLAFHLADFVRIDTGVYLPIVFSDPTFAGLSVPGYFWFQIGEKLWLGPMAALRFFDAARGTNDASLLLGFGLGYQIVNMLDFKTQLFLPDIGDGFVDVVGVGAGVQFRIGE